MSQKRSLRRIAVPVGISMALLTAGAAVTLACLQLPDDQLSAGVRVAGMDLGGLKLSEARERLLRWEAEVLATPLRLNGSGHAGGSWSVEPAEIGVRLDADRTLRDAAAVGRHDGALQRLIAWFQDREGIDIPPLWVADSETARALLKKRVAPLIARPKRDAAVRWVNESVRIVPERGGLHLDIPATVARLVGSLPLREGEAAGAPAEVALREVPARVTAEALSAITGELGSWQTHYKERGNRRTNIVTACSKINGAVLMAGELFSYNRVVGPRDEGAGFRLAPVIVKGRMVPGMGGGVCQTSSTLYNAVLRAGLEIVSRRHHAFPVHYVPPGLDATVVYPSIDLQFRNNTGAPIVLLADSSRQRVQVRVLGSKVEGRKVEILRTGLSSWAQKTLTVTQGGLAPGKRVVLDKGHAGHRATVWRVIRDPGQTERRERISSDIYGAVPRLVAVGAAAPSAQTASPQIPAAASSPLPSSAPISQAAPALR